MNVKFTAALAIIVMAFTGCSGGGGAGHSLPLLPELPSSQSGCPPATFDPVPDLNCASLNMAAPSASVDALPGGYWSGRFVDETQAVQGWVRALVGEDGRFQMQAYRYNDTNICHNWGANLSGSSTTVGNSLSGDGRIIALSPTLADGTKVADLQIEGVVAERDSIIGKWNAASGDTGCFELGQYSASDYEVPSAIEKLVGDWNDRFSVSRSQLTVAADGSFTGTDVYGCVWTGRFGLIDDHYGVYEFESELQSCTRAGEYTGLALHSWGWDPGEYWVWILADNGAQALALTFSSH